MQRAPLLTALAAVCVLVMPVMAQGRQDGGGGRRGPGPRMTPEQSQAAWKVQAASVASQLGIADADAQGLTIVYVAARKSCNEAIAATRAERDADREQDGPDKEGGQGPVARDGRGRGFGRFAEIRNAEREKLQAALQPYVSDENLKKAVAVLGSFDRSYDGMTHALIGFELGDGGLMKAMASINEYVVARGKLAGIDRELRRDAVMDMRDDLMAGLSIVLDAEQMQAFQESMRRGRRRGGDRGGPGDRDI